MTTIGKPNFTSTGCGCDPLCFHDFLPDSHTAQFQVIAADFNVNLIHPIFGQLPIGSQNPNGTFTLSWVGDVAGDVGIAYYSNEPNLLTPPATQPHIWWMTLGDANYIPPSTHPYPFGVQLNYTQAGTVNGTLDTSGNWLSYYLCDPEQRWATIGLSDETSTATYFPGLAPSYYDGWSVNVSKL